MSNIFTTETKTAMKPRHDATIRVAYYPMPVGTKPAQEEYRRVKLLEFHPDWDNRMKFRGYAYIKPETWMEHPAYERRGETQTYIEVREFMIHEDDVQELYRYCREASPGHKQYAPLIIHPVERKS